MKKLTRILLCAGGILSLAGVCLAGIGIASGGSKYVSAADLNKMEGAPEGAADVFEKEKIRLDDINSLNVRFDNIDFTVRESDDENYYLSYRLQGKNGENPLLYEVKDRELKLEEKKEGRFISVDISFLNLLLNEESVLDRGNEVVLYVPKHHNFTRSSIEVQNGDLKLEALNSRNVGININYGVADLKGCRLSGETISISNGELCAESTELSGLEVSLAYGDIGIRDGIIKDMKFCMSDGDMEVKGASVASQVTVDNNYGKVTFELKKEEARHISLLLDTNYGGIFVNGEKGARISQNDGDVNHYKYIADQETGCLTVKVSDGDVKAIVP